MKPACDHQATKASNAFDAERDKRRPSFATLTCKATRATSRTSLANA
jgi:hypothetical protein